MYDLTLHPYLGDLTILATAARNRLETVTDVLSNVTTFVLDASGDRMTTMVDALGT